MSEAEQHQRRSPLESDRGTTHITDGVVSRLAGMAAAEVEGVHMGGAASRAAGSLLENVTGSSRAGRGVSVEVGRFETAIDLTMGIDYGRDILTTVEAVRRRITDRVESLTGLRISELNVTINDIIFSDEGDGRRAGSYANTETREMTRRESTPEGPESETTRANPVSPARGERPDGSAEEETRAQDPAAEDATSEMRPVGEDAGNRGTSGEGEPRRGE